MKITKQLFIKYSAFLIVILFAIFAYRNLFHVGLPPTHDGEYHILRFYEFDKALRAGNIYPRWANDFNFGYGIPLFNFVYPLPNFVSSLIHVFGFEFIDTFKIQMAIAAIIGGLSMYMWSKQLWGKLGGITSAVLYMYSPYMFLDIFIRGSVGEVWALGLFPLFLWSITSYIKGRQNVFALSSLLLALVIFSHNILALMFFIFSILYIICLFVANKDTRNKKVIVNVIGIYILGLALSAIFWLPALVEKQFVVGLDIFDIKNNFPDLFQLIIPSWGSGFSGGELQNQMSFQIGLVNLVVILVSLIAVFQFQRKKMMEEKYITIFLLLSFSFVTFLLLSSSVFIWEHIPLMKYFQFPWRFLSLEILICAALGGSVLHAFSNKYIKYGYVVFICLMAVLVTSTYNIAPYYHMRTDSYYINRSNFIDSTNSPGNAFNTKWMKPVVSRRKGIIEDSINTKISKIRNSYTQIDYAVFSSKKDKLTINIAYFPGWNISIDQKNVPVTVSPQGTMEVVVPPGKHTLAISFDDTWVRKLALILSVCSLVFLLTHGTIKQTRIYKKYEDRNRH